MLPSRTGLQQQQSFVRPLWRWCRRLLCSCSSSDIRPSRAHGWRPESRAAATPSKQRLKQALPQQHQYLITCHPGLEQVAAKELQQPWLLEYAQNVEAVAPGRVKFASRTLAGGYAAALNLRSATRVLQLIHEEQLDPYTAAGDTVYKATRGAAAWQQLLGPGQTLGVHCVHLRNNSNITNSQLVSRRVRDAVCDAVRDARGVRPSPPEGAPDLPLAFQLLSDNLQLFRDLGGGSLHRRGYRQGATVHKAALNEAAAAGLLLLADWQDKAQHAGSVLADPMCGSGTFLIEAALIATNAAPGLLRNSSTMIGRPPHHIWPFMGWHDYDDWQWQLLLNAAQQRAEQGQHHWNQSGGQLLGNDISKGALELAQKAATKAGMSGVISLHQGHCKDWQPAQTPNMVVANPPWGLRLLPAAAGEESRHGNPSSISGRQRRGGLYQQQQPQQQEPVDDNLMDAWQELSVFLKGQCQGAEAWVLSGNPSVTQHLAMRSCKKRSVSIGGQKTAWLKYEVRRPSKQSADNR